MSKISKNSGKILEEHIEIEFRRALEANYKELSNFEIVKSSNIYHAICYHDIDPMMLKNPNQNQVFDVYLNRAFKYHDINKNIMIDAFRWEQCVGTNDMEKYGVGCGKIYYHPTTAFVKYLVYELKLK
jgi:hypothetical protein